MRYISLLLSFLFIAGWAHASIVFTFNQGETGTALDAKASGSSTVSGVTLSAAVGNTGSVFNDTASYFGINAYGSGDDTDQIDGVNVAEYFTFSFDTDVTITQFDFAALTDSGGVGEDVGYLAFEIHSGNNQTFNGSTMSNGTSGYWDVNFSVDKDEEVTIEWQDGNGFGIDSISVIPEPASLTLLGLIGVAMVLRRRVRA